MRRHLVPCVMFWLVVSASELYAVPGEDCSTAQAIALPYSENFDNSSSLPGTPSPSCNTNGQSALQNDVWYSVTTDATCELLVIEVGTSYNEVVAVYSGVDCSNLVPVGCLSYLGGPTTTVLPVSVSPLSQYWVQIGHRGSTPDGDFTAFDAFCPVCGNSIVETTEFCDDGNFVNGDGCESNCAITPPVNDDCEGALTLVNGTTTFDLNGSFGGPGNSCGSPAGSLGMDIWYDYVATCDGILVIDTCSYESDVDAVLSVYDSADCPVENADFIACSHVVGCNETYKSEVFAPVFSGQAVKVRVGRAVAFSLGAGPTDVLRVSCVPAVCGNSIVELLEGCDDGNLADGDGCDSNCTPTGCGNGILTSGEECEDGNTLSGDNCSSTCQVEGPCACVIARDCRNSLCAFDNACNCTQCVNGFCEFSCVAFGNIDCQGAVTLDDILESISSFAGNSQFHNADISPCGGNGVINVDDILGVLGAFSGANPCGCDSAAAPSICGSIAP